jgi:hypothetical protein
MLHKTYKVSEVCAFCEPDIPIGEVVFAVKEGQHAAILSKDNRGYYFLLTRDNDKTRQDMMGRGASVAWQKAIRTQPLVADHNKPTLEAVEKFLEVTE